MKKKNSILFFTLVICTVMTVFTCKQNIGLGPQVDVVPPGGQILYPDAGDTPIKGSFVLKGTAKDDDGIQSVQVVFENIETKQRSRVYEAEGFTKGSPSVLWVINIANESTGTEPGHDLVKIYPIPDGEYDAILTVTDIDGKTYETRRNYKIDNTPPVFIVSRPSRIVDGSTTPLSSDPADGYGSIFSVVGQVGEKNVVEKLNVVVPGTPINMTNMFVGTNINAQVAVCSGDPSSNPLYALQDIDKTKPIRGQLYLCDNAREYKGGDASGEGNKADWYYLWDAIYTDVIAKGYTPEVISDYFAGKKGSDKNDHEKKIQELCSDTVALAALKDKINRMDEKRSSFKLDPSKSPGFKVLGVKNLSGTGLNMSQASSMLFKVGEETSFLVELIRNKNNIPLVAGSDLAAYNASDIKIVLLKWDGTGVAEDCFKNGEHLTEITLVDFSTLTNASLITVEGGNLRIKCVFPSDEGEGIYAVKVNGTDASGEASSNSFAAYDDSNSANGGFYIIKFYAVGTGPRIRPIRPQGFKNTTLDIEADVTGIDSAGTVYYNIGAQVPTSPYPATVLTKVNSDPNDHRYKAANVNISGLNDGDHTIHFLVRAGSGSTDTDSTDFTVDKTAPTVALTYPEATDPQAGEITVSGSISDAGAGVKATSTKYILGKKTPAPNENTAAGWNAMDNSTKGSWNVRVNLDSVPAAEHGAAVGAYKKIPLYIFTEDEIGNKAVRELEILFNPDGTKPVVKVLSPQANATVGGTIQIFGTASAATGGPGAVGKVYIQFSHDGTFANTADGTFGGFTPDGGSFIPAKDWYNNGDGQLVPGTDTGGGADWRLSINGDGSFNHATMQNQDVYFRVRAENKNNNRKGEWTTPVKITVDKDAPLITDVKIDNASGTSSPQDYEMNMWLKNGKKLTAKLTDPSGIQDVKITFTKQNGTTKYQKNDAGTLDAGFTAVPTGWLTDYTSSGTSGYTLNLPLDITAMSGNSFSVTIEIKEKAAQQLTSNTSFTFRFDTQNPIGDFGTDKHMNIGNFTSSSITDAQLAEKVRDLGGSTSSGGGCKILAENSVLTVTKVTGSRVDFTASPALTAGSYNYILYKPETLIYEGSGGWIINGVANDSGSGVKEVKAKVTVNGVSSPEVTMTETDSQNRITKQLGGTVTWQGKIDLSSVPDGKGKIWYTITDKSGNAYSSDVDVIVKNKPIKVSAVTLSTDIGGTPVSFGDGALSGALNVNRDFIASITSSNFAFKNKDNSKIKVVYTGGEGTVQYKLKKGDDTTVLQPLTNVPAGGEIDLKSHLVAIGNSNGTPTKIILELWDQAHGFTQGTNSSFAKIDITTLFDALDDKSPTVVILPFHWNGENDNSLYQNSRTNGHVEIGTISGMTGSSVSGKVTIRGFAYDNVKIDSITAEVPGKTLTVTLSGTGTTWTAGTMASDGAVLTVEKLGADYLGYYVSWKLDWDTEKTTTVGIAQDIKVTANDGTTIFSDTEVTTAKTENVIRSGKKSAENAVFANKKPGQFVVFTKDETQYLTRIRSVTNNTATLEDDVPTEATTVYMYAYTANKPKTTVNVVPYITEVETGLKSADGGFKGAFSRASTGEYPVRIKEKIAFTGFNLSGATYKLGTQSLDEGTGPDAGTYEIKNSHSSGELVATVGSVESINNKVDITKPYNIEANGMNNNILTAKRKLFVWKMESIIDNNAMESPQFVMDKESKFYMSLGSLGGASPMKFFMLKNQRLGGIADMNEDTYAFETTHSKFHNTVVAYDESGNIYGGSTNTDKGGGDTTSFNFVAKKKPGVLNNYAPGAGKRRLEGSLNSARSGGEIYDVNRVQIPKVAIVGKGLDADKARIALAYYDRNNDNPPVKFRYGTVGTDSHTSMDKGLGYNLSASGDYSAKGYEIIAQTTGAGTYRSGLYVGVGLLKKSATEDRAIVAWYDSANSALMYSFKDFNKTTYTAPANPADSAAAIPSWQNKAVKVDGKAPLFIDLVVDDDGGVHIGYYSSGDGGVKYAYLDPVSVKADTVSASAFKVVKVDTYMNPGTYLKIGVRKESGKQVPYISYYHNGFYGSKNAARIAWLKDGISSAADVKQGVVDGKFTGNWVVMTVPASNGIQQYTICQGVPTSGTYQDKVIAAYFTTSNYEMAVLTK